jgi:hypothetical protein
LTKNCVQWVQCLPWGASHMCKKKSCQKTCLVVHWNFFLEFLGIFVFLVINKNIHTKLCMNVKTHHCHMNYLNWTIQYLSLKFVSSKCYLQK